MNNWRRRQSEGPFLLRAPHPIRADPLDDERPDCRHEAAERLHLRSTLDLGRWGARFFSEHVVAVVLDIYRDCTAVCARPHGGPRPAFDRPVVY